MSPKKPWADRIHVQRVSRSFGLPYIPVLGELGLCQFNVAQELNLWSGLFGGIGYTAYQILTEGL